MDYTIKQGDNLSSIAARNNTTVANIQSANNINNPNLIKAGTVLKIPNLPAGTVKTNPITSFSNLTNETPLQGNLNTTTPPVPSTIPVTNLALAQDALNATNQATSELETDNTSYINQLKASLGMTENKQADINAANETQGVNSNRKIIKEISDQILGGQTADQIQKLEKGKLGGLTVGSAQNIDSEINREAAVRNLSLGAKLSAAQGNLVLSQDLAEQAINTKYAPLEAKINNLKTYLELNKDQLTRVNAKAYKEQEILLNAKEKDLAEVKKNESDKQNILINASSQGAPSALVKKAQEAKTPAQAAMILGQFAGDYYKTELLKSQIKTDAAQRANYNANAAKTNKERSLLGATQTQTIDGKIATLPKATQERYYKLQGDFDQATQKYRGTIDAAGSLNALSKNSTAQDQTAIIFQYMKTLDPASTVREGEFALVGQAQGLGDKAIGALKKLDSGKVLSEQQIKEVVGAADKLAGSAKQNLQSSSQEYDRRAVKFGLPTGLFYEPQQINKADESAAADNILTTIQNVDTKVKNGPSVQDLINNLFNK